MFERVREDIQSVFHRDPAARTSLEVLLNYPGLHAVFFHRLSHRLWNMGFKLLARCVSSFARWMTGIEIHPGATIGRRFFIDHGMGVVIGETAEVGDDVTLYHGVTLGGTTWNKGKRHPTLGNGVVVGAGAKILGPITVGDNARVGSNAVVTKDVPPEATVVGIPGRIICKDDDADCRERQRQAMADRVGFDAYGITQDMPDPIARSIRSLLDHMHAVDQKVNAIGKELETMGRDCGQTLPELDEGQFAAVRDPISEDKPH
ncbi:MAG TPA: serine O-acetyltransferase [Dongiaceae bacterium]|nr:serine O-acetyltransferase [Dongiaceae bacterium]